jgi:hypothetical protein
MRKHRVEAGPDSVHWGFFDAALKPLITIEPGDEVTMSTVSGPPEAMPRPDSGLTVPPALSAIHVIRTSSTCPALAPRTATSPVMMCGPFSRRGTPSNCMCATI